MAQFARPNSDVTVTAFTGGYTAIDETSASDADFAYTDDNTTGQLIVGLSSVTDPASSTGHTVRVRFAKADTGTPPSTTGNTQTMQASLYQGGTLIAAFASETVGAWTTYTYNLSGSEADAITDYSALRIQIDSPASGGGSPGNRRGGAVSWAELEVPDAGNQTLTPSLIGPSTGPLTATVVFDQALTPSLIGPSTGPLTATIAEPSSYPVVAASTAGESTSGDTTHIIGLPSGIGSGDLLLVVFGMDNFSATTASVTTPASGWVEFATRIGNDASTAEQLYVFARIADGTEGTDITVTTGSSEASASVAYRITGHGVADNTDLTNKINIEVASTAPGASTTPDPPSLTASWGSDANLWIALYGWDGGQTHSSFPSGYTSNQKAITSGTASGDTGIAVATQDVTAATEDPGAGAIGGSDQWAAMTIVVRPSTGPATQTLVPALIGPSTGPLTQTVVPGAVDVGTVSLIGPSTGPLAATLASTYDLAPGLIGPSTGPLAHTVTAGAVDVGTVSVIGPSTGPLAATLAAAYDLAPGLIGPSTGPLAATTSVTYDLAPALIGPSAGPFTATIANLSGPQDVGTVSLIGPSTGPLAQTVSATYGLTAGLIGPSTGPLAATAAPTYDLTPGLIGPSTGPFTATVTTATQDLTPGLIGPSTGPLAATMALGAVNLGPDVIGPSTGPLAGTIATTYAIAACPIGPSTGPLSAAVTVGSVSLVPALIGPSTGPLAASISLPATLIPGLIGPSTGALAHAITALGASTSSTTRIQPTGSVVIKYPFGEVS